MLTVAEALAAILSTVERLPAVRVPLAEAGGLVLAEQIVSDADSPPFDKALMDGFAIRAADTQAGPVTLRVVEEVTAGRVPQLSVGPGEATRIMTGAPLPAGADAVVPIEDVRAAGDAVTITGIVATGTHILPRAAATRCGDTVLEAGRLLRAQEIGALAESGCGTVLVYPRPRVAVLATGDELVRATETPGPGQIRNSNEPMLAAQMRQAGAEPVPLGIARDERAHLQAKIREGLECDMLLLSGGVSAGKLDLVPSELAAAGVRQVFHKIQMKPGKPLWFGLLDRAASPAGRPCYVFGLPGNPVSSMVCCELFARTALRRLMGAGPELPQPVRARLTAECVMRGNRPTYHPARLDFDGTGCSPGYQVRAVDWIGSSDLRATVDANAMLLFPAGDRTYAVGDVLEAFPW